MSGTRILDALKRTLNISHGLALACALLILAAPLHAQIIFNDLYDFNCDIGGCNPQNWGYLTQGTDGNLYGTTRVGGSTGNGTIFMVTPLGAYTNLWSFDGQTAATPVGGLTLASDGNFYGTTEFGGANGSGVIFRFTPPNTVSVLHNFLSGNDGFPKTPPTQGPDGNLYGVDFFGATYRITLATGSYTRLPNSTPSGGDVCYSATCGPLFLASDGNFYGATEGGSFPGTVFRMSTTGAIKFLYNFSGGADGGFPAGPFTQGSDGYLYGTTFRGGAYGAGEIFKMTLSGGLHVLHSFDPNNDGFNPFTGLLAASDGYFYGTTTSGGNFGPGTIYRITSNGVFEKLLDFTGNGGGIPGNQSFTTLMEDTDGSSYGLTFGGGEFGTGNFFSLTPQNNFVQILKIVGPIFVLPGVPVQVLGNNLTQTYSVAFAGENTSFRAGADTYLTATVPQDAIDGPITVTYVTGLQVQTQTPIHILPVINNLDPTSGPPGTQVGIVGGGFSRASTVTFGGVKASFTVVNPTLIQAVVPANAKSGKVKVTTPNGTATSKQKFTVT